MHCIIRRYVVQLGGFAAIPMCSNNNLQDPDAKKIHVKHFPVSIGFCGSLFCDSVHNF